MSNHDMLIQATTSCTMSGCMVLVATSIDYSAYHIYHQRAGASLAVHAALEHPDLFKGVVFCAGPTVLGSDRYALTMHFLVLIARLFPRTTMPGLVATTRTRDKTQAQMYDNDPFAGRISFSLARQNLNLSNDTMAVAKQITFPYLILHGDDDQLCFVEGSKMLHVKTNSEDKTMKVFPGAQHALYAEMPEVKEEMQRDISSWIQKTGRKTGGTKLKIKLDGLDDS